MGSANRLKNVRATMGSHFIVAVGVQIKESCDSFQACHAIFMPGTNEAR
jgi:hypothetical protein